MKIWLVLLLVLVVVFVSVAVPPSASALPIEICCQMGNPGCCFMVLIELWWEGFCDFPGAPIT